MWTRIGFPALRYTSGNVYSGTSGEVPERTVGGVGLRDDLKEGKRVDRFRENG